MRRSVPLAPLPLLALALLALAAPTASAAMPPAVIVLVPSSQSTVDIWWSPAVEPVIAYNVYVMDDNHVVFLLATFPVGAIEASAPSGFLDYGVASVDVVGVGAINWYTNCVSVRPPSPYVWVSEGAC